MVNAADAPQRLRTSGFPARSADITVATTWVSKSVALGKEWPNRAVDDATGEDFVGSGAPLATEESAGDLACGEGLFLVLDRQREEIETFARCDRIPR